MSFVNLWKLQQPFFLPELGELSRRRLFVRIVENSNHLPRHMKQVAVSSGSAKKFSAAFSTLLHRIYARQV
jgi:hypothetical protein